MASAMNDWRIERLDKTHQRAEFRCGQTALDDFLRILVSQYEKRNLGRTCVAVRADESRGRPLFRTSPRTRHVVCRDIRSQRSYWRGSQWTRRFSGKG